MIRSWELSKGYASVQGFLQQHATNPTTMLPMNVFIDLDEFDCAKLN